MDSAECTAMVVSVRHILTVFFLQKKIFSPYMRNPFFLHFEKCVPRVDNGGIKDFPKFSNFLFSFFHAKHFLQKLKKKMLTYEI